MCLLSTKCGRQLNVSYIWVKILMSSVIGPSLPPSLYLLSSHNRRHCVVETMNKVLYKLLNHSVHNFTLFVLIVCVRHKRITNQKAEMLF